VFGQSTSSVGVSGESGSGYGVYGKSVNGFAMGAEGNVTQNVDKGGWVKALVHVGGGSSPAIDACFNSFLAGSSASTPPCGFSLTVHSVREL
jgi:hypothetical protein